MLITSGALSAQEVKTKLGFFQKPFQMKKNDVFFFVISSLILEIRYSRKK